MDCKLCRVEIEVAGANAPPGRGAAAHLAGCAACRTFRAERVSLRGLVGGLARVDAPNDFEFRLRARLATEATPRGHSGWQAYFPRAAWAAAALCLLIAAGVSLRPRQQETPAVAVVDSQTPAVAAVVGGSELSQESKESRGGSPNGMLPDGGSAIETSAGETKGRVTNRRRDRRVRRQTFVPPPVREEIATESGGVGERFAEHSRSVIGGTIIALPVSAEERPLQVIFKDMQGASRVVRVDPVAFGSREPNATGARVVNAAHKQGVW